MMRPGNLHERVLRNCKLQRLYKAIFLNFM